MKTFKPSLRNWLHHFAINADPEPWCSCGFYGTGNRSIRILSGCLLHAHDLQPETALKASLNVDQSSVLHRNIEQSIMLEHRRLPCLASELLAFLLVLIKNCTEGETLRDTDGTKRRKDIRNSIIIIIIKD